MSQASVGRESDKFMLRFPDGMRDVLKAEAAKNGRSMNAEIVARLEHYDSLLDRVEELEATVRGHDYDLAAVVKERDGYAEAEQALARQLHEAKARIEGYESQLESKYQLEKECWGLKDEIVRLRDTLAEARMIQAALGNSFESSRERVADLEQKLADTTKALLRAEKPDPPALTPEAFDALFTPRIGEVIDGAVESAFRKYVRERTERDQKD